MDPLSIIASVLGITSVAAHSTKALYELIDGIRSAPPEIKNISRDTHAFYSILFSLESSLKDSKIIAVIAEDDSLTVSAVQHGNLTNFWELTLRRRICSIKLIVAGSVGSGKPIRRGSGDSDAGFALRRYVEEKDTISRYANSLAPPSPPTEAFEAGMELSPELPTTLQGTEPGPKNPVVDKVERLHRAENQRNAMLSAANSGDDLQLEVAIIEGANVNAKGTDGKASMHIAAAQGNLNIVQLLLDHNADVDIKATSRGDARERKFEGGRTPLHWAAHKGHKDIVQLLIANKANVNAKNSSGRTPLQEALMHGRTGIAKILLSSSASVDIRDNEHWTPLHQASHSNSPLINTLIDKGCDIEAQTSDKTIWTGANRYLVAPPLFLAAGNGYEAAVRTLLARSANSRSRNIIGEMPIHVACWQGHAPIVRIMLDAGVDIEERDLTYDETPLIKAASTGQTHILRLLLDRGADMDAINHQGRNALNHAKLYRKTGNEEAVYFLEQVYKRRDVIEKSETEKKEAERREAKRREAEKREAERKEVERRKAERKEVERREAEKKEAERKEVEKREAERKEVERREAEKKEAEGKEVEKREAERKEVERREAERKEAEKREAERKEVERREVERKEAEKREVERRETKRRENKRRDAEKRDLIEKREAERRETERKEAERKEIEKREAEKREAERKEVERREAERKETERKKVEKREAERIGAKRIDAENRDIEKREAERKETKRRENKRRDAEKIKVLEIKYAEARENKRRKDEEGRE
ncbi:MAG: hypothetical protein Q9179_005651 [Wetmoreana sp. 5 TL-2023]